MTNKKAIEILKEMEELFAFDSLRAIKKGRKALEKIERQKDEERNERTV